MSAVPVTNPASEALLDDPVRASLLGVHARFADSVGRVLRYQVDVAPFVAVPADPDEQDWADLATLLGPGGQAPLVGFAGEGPAGWEVQTVGAGVQLVSESVVGAPAPDAVRLGLDDVPEILELIARTKPGPYLPRTVELGTYLGIRRKGVLVAMAGERLHPPGFTEISAVCTDAQFRGQGLATTLVHAVAYGIQQRGETPFLHTGADNHTAIRLYESLGFRLRKRSVFRAATVPAAA